VPLLEGRVAVVTGAARGIGEAVAVRFAAEGASIAILDMDVAGADGTARQVRQAGGTAVTLPLVIGADEAPIEAAIADVESQLGRIDILVNNAAVMDLSDVDRDIESTGSDVWVQMMSVNVIGPALLAKHAIPAMLRTGRGGCVINLASVGSFQGDVRHVAYRTSKAALVNLTRCIAASHGRRGIRCNAIAPGLVMSPAAYEHMSKERAEIFEYGRLIATPGVPEDPAALALFLASDESRYITGQTLIIDGGQSAVPASFALSQFRGVGR
jgi:NAD(P)-dependent dehydrogenase (short-subunit alcohol dehydrogenase family)